MKISKKGSKSSYVIGFFAASLSIITVISAMLLSIPVTNAETTTSNASISVGMSCSMAVTPGTGGTATSDGYSYSATVTPGVPSEIEGSILTTTCNGPGNYSLYAIGYSGDSYDTPTNTQMISSAGSNNIVTGTATSGSTSNWAFKLASVSGTSAPTIISPYSSYSNIPGDNFAKVATMLGTTGLASTSAVQAKYQVYASSTQPAGAYTGKVKYTFVYPNDAPAPTPTFCTDTATCMQTMTTCPSTPTTVTDGRDGKQYSVALIGDACWMTTNLDLAGGTALSADDTDVTSAYISSFTTSNNLTKSGDTIVLPASTTDSGFDTVNYSYVANSGNASSDCSSAPGCYSYYSWDAATLGSGRTITTGVVDTEQSICPKGWHLPSTRYSSDNTSDFRKLMIALGGSRSISSYDSSTTPTGAVMSSSLRSSPRNFLYNGSYENGHLTSVADGFYYTSTANGENAYSVFIRSDGVFSAMTGNRSDGFAVRCVLDS